MAAFIAPGSLADIVVTIGGSTWHIGANTIVYVIIAVIIGFIGEHIAGWRLPFGIVGGFIAGLVGIWLMNNVIHINGLPDFSIDGVLIIHALIGAIIFVAIWHLVTYPFLRSRPRSRVGYRSY